MTGKSIKIIGFGFVLGLLVASVNFRIGQSGYIPADVSSPAMLKSTLEPQSVNPTPTPLPVLEVQAPTGETSVPFTITDDECCPYPRWSADSEWVLFVDSVGLDGPGLYGVPFAGGRATFLTSRVGSFSEDLSLVAYPEAGLVYVERWAIGDRWLVPSQGREVHISHENEWIAWQYGSTSIQNQDLKQQTIWIANIKGEDSRALVTVHGGGFIGWVDEGKALLVSGRLSPLSPSGIWRVDRVTGAARLLFSTERARDVLISPGGEWLAFTVAFQSDHEQNGLWTLKTDGSLVVRLPVYGSYRWRSEGELLVIPFDFEEDGPYLWQINIENDQIWALTDPHELEMSIANNDWQASPDGEKIVFYSQTDRNLWVLRLPEVPQ